MHFGYSRPPCKCSKFCPPNETFSRSINALTDSGVHVLLHFSSVSFLNNKGQQFFSISDSSIAFPKATLLIACKYNEIIILCSYRRVPIPTIQRILYMKPLKNLVSRWTIAWIDFVLKLGPARRQYCQTEKSGFSTPPYSSRGGGYPNYDFIGQSKENRPKLFI